MFSFALLQTCERHQPVQSRNHIQNQDESQVGPVRCHLYPDESEMLINCDQLLWYKIMTDLRVLESPAIR